MNHIKLFEELSIDDPRNLTGWVNVKIDKMTYIRMSRYVKSLDHVLRKIPGIKWDLSEKMSFLSRIDEEIVRTDIQLRDKISIITILQYLKETRDQFNASSAGFLFEGFIAGLVHGKLSDDSHGRADVVPDPDQVEEQDDRDENFIYKLDGKSLNYQIKLYTPGGNIRVNVGDDIMQCDKYVICFKEGNILKVHILDPREGDPEYLGLFSGTTRGDDVVRYSGNHMIINSIKLERKHKPYKIDLGNLDSLLEVCGENLKKSIERLYDLLAELHYDIDSLIGGHDKFKRYVGIDVASNNSIAVADMLREEILKMTGSIRGN